MLGKTEKFVVALTLTVTLAGVQALAGFPANGAAEESQAGGSRHEAVATAPGGSNAGSFPPELEISQYARVGRLAVELIRGGATQEVPFDWVFHTNDEFRFKIATNRDGWLYILHRSPGGQLQLLYPPIDRKTGKAAGNSPVEKNKHYFVPAPTEGSFVFEKDTGAETFFLVIKDRPEPPALTDIMVSSVQPTSQKQGASGRQEQPQAQESEAAPAGKTYSPRQDAATSPLRQQLKQKALDALNYSIIPRGAKKVASLSYRGVSFKPAATDADPGTYFAPEPDSELQDAWFVFKLNHVE